MDILLIIKITIAILTIFTGLISLIRPLSIKGFTGLDVTGPRGVTEIRAIMGGVFLGAGLAPLLLSTPAAWQMLGILYLAIGIVRLPAMFLDRSVEKSNVISLVVEIVFGVILVL